LIPPRKRDVPKLISKVLPTYPSEARQQHVRGEVVLDIALNDDGTVETVEVIDGNPLLAEPATAAVKQWRYRPLIAQGNPVVKFVVVISFGRSGKVH
jgi:protein TonB